MTKAVQFDSYGGIDVLEVRDVSRPVPGAGEVLVEVRAAGINISEAAIRAGAVHDLFPATFPSGQGSDLAGVVTELGSGVTGFAVGDEVIGFSNLRSSHAEYVTVPATQLTAKPSEVSWEVAGSLFVAGAPAYAAVRAMGLVTGATVSTGGAGDAPRSGGYGSDRGCGRRCRFDRGSTRPARRGHGPRHRRAVQRFLARRAWRGPGQPW